MRPWHNTDGGNVEYYPYCQFLIRDEKYFPANKMHPFKSIQIKIKGHVGFTLIELLIVVALVAVLAAIVQSSYKSYMERVRVSLAISDINNIVSKLNAFRLDSRKYPDSLAEIGEASRLDPWGKPYEYLNLTAKTGNGGARRDKNLNPLNSDFDLYSRGKNGKTKLPISQFDSLDDVLRANDGAFLDLSAKY